MGKEQEILKALQEDGSDPDKVKDYLQNMEKHPRCALLPSPEILESAELKGEDVTKTLSDYAKVLAWVTDRGLLNTRLYSQQKPEEIESGIAQLSDVCYGALVNFAFNHAFAAIKNTFTPKSEELVFWYYAGHGLGKDKEKIKNLGNESAIPKLDKVSFLFERSTSADKPPTRTVKGGELCLHQAGFCDLQGVLEVWTAALQSKSQNTKCDNDEKHNKHLVLILDSCYSGTFADDLKTLEEEGSICNPWKENGCSVTVQASCTADKSTFGGYFTPLFLHLNKDPGHLNKLIEEWRSMTDDQKHTFSSLQLPSPNVATTRNLSDIRNGPVSKIKCQGFSVKLFHDPGFFKYCFVTWSRAQSGESRALSSSEVNQFLSQKQYKVLDFKLKKLSPEAKMFAGTPLGLFLVEYGKAPENYAVCVHLHFPVNNTSDVSRINFVGMNLQKDHHGALIYAAEKPKLTVKNNPNVMKLIAACRAEVDSHDESLWVDVSKWKMTNNEPGVKGMFRLQVRSEEFQKYLDGMHARTVP